jgi:hypothetical protein
VAAPEATLEIDEQGTAGLGDMISRVNQAKRRRDERVLAGMLIGASRVGGVPDLPPGVAWPTYDGKPVTFVAQIDLSELPREVGALLPAEGWLYAFYDIDASVPAETGQVIYYRGERASLRRADWPAGAAHPDDPRNKTGPVVHEVAPVSFRVRGTAADEKARALRAQRDAGQETARDAGHLLGEPGAIDETAGDIADYLDRSGDDWVNLLTVNSIGSMCWSDAGYLNFVIRRSDLLRGDFSKVCASFWSS